MRYLLCIILLFPGLQSYSQKWGYGFRIGGGIASQKINDPAIISTGTITTFNLGMVVKYYLPKQYLIQTGLNLLNKGTVITEDAITTTPHVTYIDLPVGLVKRFAFPGLGILYAGAGGYADYGIRGKYTYETPSSLSSDKLEFGKDKFLLHTDFGAQAVAGLELNNNLLFEFRYEYGLKNLTTNPLKDTGTSAIYNRLLTVSLGYVFR